MNFALGLGLITFGVSMGWITATLIRHGVVADLLEQNERMRAGLRGVCAAIDRHSFPSSVRRIAEHALHDVFDDDDALGEIVIVPEGAPRG